MKNNIKYTVKGMAGLFFFCILAAFCGAVSVQAEEMGEVSSSPAGVGQAPYFAITETNLALGESFILELFGNTEDSVVYASSDPAVADISAPDAEGVSVWAEKTGTAVISAEIGGVVLTCKITVTDPNLNKTYGFYEKKKGISLKLTGINKKSSPVWTSSDTSVASVTKNGYVRTKKLGSATITCEVDGTELEFFLAVGKSLVVKAMRYGYSKVGKCRYSQARRMSRYYFDCSSFVYRCYRSAGRYLVRKTSWAPVAADIGWYYVKKGKQIKAASASYSPAKLRPGDLICYGGSKAPRNGRYKRIYHIAMYIGNGKTMESSSTYNNVVIRDRGQLLKKYIPVIVRPCA